MQFEQAVYEYVIAKTEGRKAVRPNTLEGYLSAIKCHLLPRWTGYQIEKITDDEMQAWVDDFTRPGTAIKAFKTLRQIVRWYLKRYRVRMYDETQSVEIAVCRYHWVSRDVQRGFHIVYGKLARP